MRPSTLLRLATRPSHLHPRPQHIRLITTTPSPPATAYPITAHGPPPSAPTPTRSAVTEHRQRLKSAAAAAGQRFWTEAHVVAHPSDNTLRLHLDHRTLKTPLQAPLAIPASKPLLAAGIALEWNALRRSADAARGHLVPLTQLAGRAIDLTDATREEVVQNLIRYLDTDTLLCLAPTETRKLRKRQEEALKPVLSWLRERMWPGVDIATVDGDHGFGGRRQDARTREVLMDWMRGLGAWELVGFERCVLAGKSFLVGARMVGEWGSQSRERTWGVEEAARAASVEVNFQTGVWGEVEDTHDVEKEDLRRQIGAGWLLIANQE
ncbi:hypothetical protein EDC01DRAFT_478439 [Geopyxis carbonaria]|nr:hypothetical protein EDC01DRAFT_478439 [Geopyxis carbonaria]